MKKVIEVSLQLDSAQINGKSKEEIAEFLKSKVNPIMMDMLTERSRGGEAGCSVHSDGGWECHGSIRF